MDMQMFCIVWLFGINELKITFGLNKHGLNSDRSLVAILIRLLKGRNLKLLRKDITTFYVETHRVRHRGTCMVPATPNGNIIALC